MDDGTRAGTDARAGAAEDAHRMRERIGGRLGELSERLDPESFALLLKVMSGFGRAAGDRRGRVDLELTPAERALYTPQFQQEVIRLLGLAGVPASAVAPEGPGAP